MRFQKAEALLNLGIKLSASPTGLTLGDIAEEFGVSRRTAERMLAALEGLFTHVEEANPGERPKRWRIPPGMMSRLVRIDAQELAALHWAADLLEQTSSPDQAKLLRSLISKLRANSSAATLNRIEPDLELLLEAEGAIHRVGPRIRIESAVLSVLREALLGCREVRMRYRSRETAERNRMIVHPYGFLYGTRPYLVAYSPYAHDYRLFSLANIESAKATNTTFIRRPFSLSDYAAQSFGLFQGEPMDVALRFSAMAASDARTYEFHPSQIVKRQKDGSLLVRFRASGELELSWHLFTWGTEVEVLSPPSLKARMDCIRAVLVELEREL